MDNERQKNFTTLPLTCSSVIWPAGGSRENRRLRGRSGWERRRGKLQRWRWWWWRWWWKRGGRRGERATVVGMAWNQTQAGNIPAAAAHRVPAVAHAARRPQPGQFEPLPTSSTSIAKTSNTSILIKKQMQLVKIHPEPQFGALTDLFTFRHPEGILWGHFLAPSCGSESSLTWWCGGLTRLVD